MKTNVKKTNPAFKQRQVLPFLPSHTTRTGGAKDNSKSTPAKPAGPADANPTWVTTE